MLVEAVSRRIAYRWPGGEVHLKPGQPVDLPDDRAQRLLAKVPGEVRAVTPTPEPEGTPLVGRVVSWDSPLFGLLSATVLAEAGGMVTVWHPLTEREAVIPAGWLCRTEVGSGQP